MELHVSSILKVGALWDAPRALLYMRAVGYEGTLCVAGTGGSYMRGCHREERALVIVIDLCLGRGLSECVSIICLMKTQGRRAIHVSSTREMWLQKNCA